MTTKEIEQYVSKQPFRPFRLVLDTGEQVTVRKPRKALMSGPSVAVVGVCRRDKRAMGVEKLRIVRIERIVSVAHVSADAT